MRHYRVDRAHSNSYERWKDMGSPQPPTTQQHAALEKAGQLQMVEPESRVKAESGRLVVRFPLPRQGVSLVRLAW
jgi:xylan 1,4-beta-xylosidase